MPFGALNVSTSRMGGPTRGTTRMALQDPLLSSRAVKSGCNLVGVLASSPSCEIYAYRGLRLPPLLAALYLEYGGVNIQMGVEAFANLIKIDQECP